jgi:very-short-patch-repair endonuclease
MTVQSPASRPLTVNERKLVQDWILDLVPGDGAAVGNKTLRQRLEQKAELHDFAVTDEDYWSIREELVERGELQKGSGRGGSVFRFDSSWKPSSQPATINETHWEDLGEAASDSPESLEKLRSRLLDLSARNRLLNFSHARSKRFARIIDELPDHLFETLMADQTMRFAPVPEPTERQLIEHGYLKYDEQTGSVSELKKSPTAETWAQTLGMHISYELPTESGVPSDKHADDAIQTLYYPAELESRLQILHAQSRLSLDETGANILYLAIGFLEWDESVAGKNSPRLAPLMLIPVRLEKGKLNPKTATFDYELVSTGEDILTNLSLREKLRREFGIALPRITDNVLPEDYFNRVRDTVLEVKPDWKLHRFASLGLFEFGKLMMYLDLEPGKNQGLLQSRLVQQLIGLGESERFESSVSGFSNEHAIDELQDVHQNYPLIDDADSSQHSALVDVMRGEDLVIEGPPGTGKSQTITNIISAAMAQGKKILFVAEKRAALEVVKNRLTRAGLGEFCLELHSHKSQKSAVAASIGERISNRGSYRQPSELNELISNYERLKQRLNDHVRHLHAPYGETGLTAHQILMQATRLREGLFIRPADFHPSSVANLDKNQVQEQAGYFAHVYTKTANEAGYNGQLETHPWFGCTKTQINGLERSQLLSQLQQAIEALNSLDGVRSKASNGLGVVETASLPPKALQELASALSAMPMPKGDEDWDLLSQLDASSCEALQAWLEGMDLLMQQQITLSQALHPRVIQSHQELEALKTACSQIRQHNDTNGLKLDELLDLILKAQAFIDEAPKAQLLIQTIAKAVPAQSLRTDKQGIEQVTLLLDLMLQMPIALAEWRHNRFEDALLDRALPEISELLTEIKRDEEKAGGVFMLDRLPDHNRLEDLQRLLADDSPFRWLKSSWRAARAEVLGIVRPGIKLKTAIQTLPDAIAFKHNHHRLATTPSYREALGEHFQGVETKSGDLIALRNWYRALRDNCGRGFGGNVWIAEYLLKESSQVLERLLSDANGLKEYFSGVLAHRNELEKILPLDSHQLKSQDLLAANGLYIRLVKELGAALDALLLIVTEQAPTTGRILELAQAVENWQERATASQNNAELLACLRGEDLPRFDNLAEARSRLIAWRHTVSFVRPIMTLPIRHLLVHQLSTCTPKQAEQLVSDWNALSRELNSALQAWEHALAGFTSTAQLEPSHWWKRVNQDDLTAVKQRLQWAAQNEELLEHWLEYRRLRKRLADLGFEAVIFAVETQTLAADKARDACLLGLLDSWAKQILENNPALGQFSGKDQEAIRTRFAEIDTQLTKLQREQLAAKIDQHKVPEGNNSGKVKDRTQLALLKHEAGKKTRHESIRALMLRAPEALQGLKPCFMMSPMAVAQYLPAGKVHFDMIVMDEASQMRPEEALGAISRGAQLVVVGDPKQLPPTSFFSRQGGDDDDDSAETSLAQDSESILEAAMPLFKLRRLRWHYRSRHESLIAFSNKAFYDNNLVVYPSPHRESNEFGVKFVRVARGRFVEQRNIEEAEIVAKAIEHHLLHRPGESLGVVAMNVKQAEQVDRALEQLAKQNIALQDALSRNKEVDEPLFIKNLENVQGDERDVIYISSTYGPMEAGGSVPQRFGPINGADGWRRLNVLFTRSKKRMQVFASFTSSDVVATGTSSRGVCALRDFLQFAESGLMPQTRETGRAPDSDFEVAVIAALERHGYQCEPQVGVAGYFIDLAVRDPGQPGRYLMGIECDGAAYHSAKSARDRDRLRQSVLEQLGWRIRRIWSVDWFRNAKLQLEPILQELAALRTVPATEELSEQGEEQIIRQVAEEQSQHAERIIQDGDTTLREKLLYLDEQIIRPALPDTQNNRRLLRPAMLEALLEFRPVDRSELQQRLPGYLREGTDPAEGRFIDDVLTLIGEYT